MWVFVTGPSGNQVKITIMYFLSAGGFQLSGVLKAESA